MIIYETLSRQLYVLFGFLNEVDTFKSSLILLYCIEGIEMRQRSCKVRRLLFLKRYCLFQHTAAIFILERKEGEIGR